MGSNYQHMICTELPLFGTPKCTAHAGEACTSGSVLQAVQPTSSPTEHASTPLPARLHLSEFTPPEKMDLAGPFRNLLPAEPAQAARRDLYAGPAAPDMQQQSAWYDAQQQRYRADSLPINWQSQLLAQPLPQPVAAAGTASALTQEQLQQAFAVLAQLAAQHQTSAVAAQPRVPALQQPAATAVVPRLATLAQVRAELDQCDIDLGMQASIALPVQRWHLSICHKACIGKHVGVLTLGLRSGD